jgi:MinD superfamily P-loop ATPase
MSFKIAIASGKGGTGKTTISVNLYNYLKNNLYNSVKLVDCDVEEPNSKLFFKDKTLKNTQTITQMVPFIDANKCTFCKKCVEYCEFNAISIIQKLKFAEVSPDLCHSCGACFVACKFDAIEEHTKTIGEIKHYNSNNKDYISEGNLTIGSPMQTMVIKELKKQTLDDTSIIIYDAPPGTSCPVVETISDADYIILVTEPTPFGLHDLILTVNLLKEINKPFGVIINKAGIGNNDVYKYLKDNNIKIIEEIPFDKEYAKLYASGDLLQNKHSAIQEKYKNITKHIENKIIHHT